MSDDLAREWGRARADSFEPAFVRELTLVAHQARAELLT